MIEELVTGFLVTAGLIRARDQIINIAYDPDRRQASAKLELPRGCLSDFRNEKGFVSPPRAAGSAQTNTGFRVTADTLLSAMREFRDRAERPGRPKSVHAAAIAGVAGILAHAEDVGRNNATDKVVGACVLQDIPTHDKMLLTTGRISLEVATKCLRAGIPIISSFKAPTTGAVDLARNAAIALAGRVTAGGMVLFSADWRIE
jgi:FdhD protein